MSSSCLTYKTFVHKSTNVYFPYFFLYLWMWAELWDCQDFSPFYLHLFKTFLSYKQFGRYFFIQINRSFFNSKTKICCWTSQFQVQVKIDNLYISLYLFYFNLYELRTTLLLILSAMFSWLLVITLLTASHTCCVNMSL